MARYRCIRSFDVHQSDDDGALIEDAPMVRIPEGKVYEAARPGLNLDWWLRAADGSWLDLDDGTFSDCFEEVDE